MYQLCDYHFPNSGTPENSLVITGSIIDMYPPTICGLFLNDPDPIYLYEVTVGSLTLNVYKLVIDNDVNNIH